MTSRVNHQESSNPFVFVVGCPRSGTTLLRRLLNAHPELAIPKAETHWIPKFFLNRRGVEPDGSVGTRFIDTLLEYERFGKLGIPRADLLGILGARKSIPYAVFVRRLFDEIARKEGKRLAGDKTPGYARFLPVLNDLFPDARFVHLVRDGRDVALSILNWTRLEKTAGSLESFQEDPLITTALLWEWLVRLGLESAADLPAGRCLLVRYESLLADTESTCQELCSFLGLPFAGEMLDYHVGRQKQGGELSAKKAWLPPTKGLRDWRSQMPESDQLRFEAASGALLAELGYERRHRDLPQSLLSEARSLRRRFSRRPHPRAWSN